MNVSRTRFPVRRPLVRRSAGPGLARIQGKKSPTWLEYLKNSWFKFQEEDRSLESFEGLGGNIIPLDDTSKIPDEILNQILNFQIDIPKAVQSLPTFEVNMFYIWS